MPEYSDLPNPGFPVPSLFDLGDGGDMMDGGKRPGIPTPTGVILVNDNGKLMDITDDDYSLILREVATSPTVERAEQATITKEFVTDYENGKILLASLGRGTLLVSEDGDVTRVLSSKMDRARPGHVILTVVSESISFDTPPDEFSIEPVELGVHIIKHPRYFYALNPESLDYNTNYFQLPSGTWVTLADVKQRIIRLIQLYMDSPVYPTVFNFESQFHASALANISGNYIQIPYYNPNYNPLADSPSDNYPQWDGTTAHIPTGNYQYFWVQVPTNNPQILLAMAAAREIIEKIWRQEEQPYIVGYQLTWSTYYFRPPFVHPGGVLDDPIFNGIEEVPDYFISPEYPPDRSVTIFDKLPVFNQQCYSVYGVFSGESGVYGVDYAISWLRKSDQIDYQRTWFKRTRTWLGAPIGMWDAQLYSSWIRPLQASDYVTTFKSLTPPKPT